MGLVKKAGIIMIVALLAISGIMAAVAYTQANITNPAGVVTISTDSALLALTPNEGKGYKDQTAYVEDGVLKFNFAAGLGLDPDDGRAPWKQDQINVTHGLQPGSVYIFEDLFKITNNSFDSVRFKIRVEGDLADFEHMYIGKNATGFSSLAFTLDADGKLVAPKPPLHSGISWFYPGNNWGTINPAISHWNYQWISLAFVVPEGADLENISGTIIIDAWTDF